MKMHRKMDDGNCLLPGDIGCVHDKMRDVVSA
jgi:hypothetical protein